MNIMYYRRQLADYRWLEVSVVRQLHALHWELVIFVIFEGSELSYAPYPGVLQANCSLACVRAQMEVSGMVRSGGWLSCRMQNAIGGSVWT